MHCHPSRVATAALALTLTLAPLTAPAANAITVRTFSRGATVAVFGDSTVAINNTVADHTVSFSPKNCVSYAGTWPKQVFSKIRPRYTVADLSCPGARTTMFWKMNPEKYVGPRTRMVVLTYGSNDFGTYSFFKRAKRSTTGVYPSADAMSKHSAEVTKNMGEMIDFIKAAAPKAEILVMGYMNYVPPYSQQPCQALYPKLTPMSQNNVFFYRSMVNTTLKKVAADNSVNFLLPDPLNKHTLCEPNPADRWMSGSGKREYQFHPNQAAHNAIYKKVTHVIRSNHLLFL